MKHAVFFAFALALTAHAEPAPSRSYSVLCVAYSADGSQLATSGICRPVVLRDPETGKETRRLAETSGWVGTAAFTPDGRFLASTCRDEKIHDNTVALLPVAGRMKSRVVGSIDTDEWINSVAITPDGRTLAAVGGRSSVVLWDLGNEKELRKLPCKGFRLCLCFSADGKIIASPTDDEDVVRLWEVATGKELMPIPHRATWAAFSPDGTLFATADFKNVKLWDAKTWKELRTLQGGAACLTFSPDGKVLASGLGKSLYLTDPAAGKGIRTIPCVGSVTSIAFSPNGRRVAAGLYEQSALQIWEADTGKELVKIDLPPNSKQ